MTAWTNDTIVNVWSSTKTVTSLAALMVIDRGLVEPTAPVGTHWPQFAANIKQDIEIRHILSHTSGVTRRDRIHPDLVALLTSSAIDQTPEELER